jgi:hypothetical protein
MNGTDRVIADVSRDMVLAIVPSELPMFRANSAAYFADPEASLRPKKHREEMLGFGAAEAAVFVTPVILTVVRAAFEFLVTQAGKALRSEAEATVAQWFKALFKPLKPADAPSTLAAPALNSEQLQKLRAVAFDKASQYLDAGRAGQLADELIGRLVTT